MFQEDAYLSSNVDVLKQDINRIAQYAMYAYCIFALFSLAFSVCRQAGLSFRTSPILIPISPILVTIKQLVLQLAPIALWGIFRYTLPAGVKLLRRCSELMVLYYVLSFILGQCFNLLPAAVFYLAGNTRQTAFISVNIISMITTTSAYIYAYYRMFRAIKTIGCFGQ